MNPATLHEWVLLVPADLVDTLSDALQALDALSVSVEDADAHTDAEQALFGEPGMPPPKPGWERSRIVALFSSQASAQEAADLLSVQDFFVGCTAQSIQPVPDEDWVRLTQSQFTPVEITPDFWIVPTWHEPPLAAKKIIRLDPGLAFGTGTHPTTRMCLRWIAAQSANRPALGRVLDYGCGSGILAIAAALYGATTVDAVDIDPAAVTASVANAQVNLALPMLETPVAQLFNAGLPDLAVGKYQVVLANILAMPLQVLAPLLCGHVAPGGSLVLAGILERQAEILQTAYAPYCTLRVADSAEGWVLMTAAF